MSKKQNEGTGKEFGSESSPMFNPPISEDWLNQQRNFGVQTNIPEVTTGTGTTINDNVLQNWQSGSSTVTFDSSPSNTEIMAKNNEIMDKMDAMIQALDIKKDVEKILEAKKIADKLME